MRFFRAWPLIVIGLLVISFLGGVYSEALAQNSRKNQPPKSSSRKSAKVPEKPVAIEPAPKPITAQSLAHLHETMAQEPFLTEGDLTVFLANLSLIGALGEDLSLIEKLREKSGWSENRLVYAVTKINLGILALFDPDNPRLAQAPQFAKPVGQELALIDKRRAEISRAMSGLGARSGAK
ncbi:MAG: hypothetical protein LBT38_01395 [Deltaproteobacteria bacterium]|jgi:hypothetical protein|nr:hypothetical protein [Deltaproteobacteria bacterium]